MRKVAVLDDWQNIARQSADWSALTKRAEVVFFDKAFANEDEAAEQLAEFDILMAMRERTAFPTSLVCRLPKLAMFNLTGKRAPSIDMVTLKKQGVTVCYTGGGGTGEQTAQLALGLMLAAVRDIQASGIAMRNGRFQDGVKGGVMLTGKTLGIIGLGRIGSLMARYGQVLGMRVIAWSQGLANRPPPGNGVEVVSKEELLASSDIVSLHLVLSQRTRGIIAATDLAQMKPGAVLINTSRGALIDEAALLEAVKSDRVIAALDVYDKEPLPADHPLRSAPNTVLTPHLGYCTTDVFEEFYRDSIENVIAFLDEKPIRLIEVSSN